MSVFSLFGFIRKKFKLYLFFIGYFLFNINEVYIYKYRFEVNLYNIFINLLFGLYFFIKLIKKLFDF